jgi:hypothetical protein
MKLHLLAAIAVLVSAFVHAKLFFFDGFKDQDVVGPAFMLNAVAGVVIAVLLLTWQHWVPAFLTLGFGLSTLGAFVVATLPAGLFGVHEHWVGAYVWMAAVAEATAIVTGGVLLWQTFPRGASASTSSAKAQHRLSLRGAHHH